MKLFPDYPAHPVFYGPACNTAEIWRFIAGLLLCVVLFFIGTQFYLRGIQLVAPAVLGGLAAGHTAQAMYFLMFSFVTILLSAGIVVRVLHRRSPMSLIGSPGLALSQFSGVLFLLVVISVGLLVLMSLGAAEPVIPNMAFGRWIVLLPLSLLAVLIQVSAEEVFFRGYLQQQLAARFRSPWVWMVLPSAFFAVGHYEPELAGENAVLIAVWSGLFGLMMADLTARAGSLGPAIAVHFCNNVLALLVVSLPDKLNGLALFVAPFGLQDVEAMRAYLPVDFMQMVVFWLAARLALRR